MRFPSGCENVKRAVKPTPDALIHDGQLTAHGLQLSAGVRRKEGPLHYGVLFKQKYARKAMYFKS